MTAPLIERAATELMNGNRWSPYFAAFATLVGVVIYYFDPSWLGLANFSPLLPMVFLGYFVLQVIMAVVLTQRESNEEWTTA